MPDASLVKFLLVRAMVNLEADSSGSARVPSLVAMFETSGVHELVDTPLSVQPAGPSAVSGSGSSSLRLFPFLDGYSCRPPALSRYGFHVPSWVDLDQHRFQVFHSESAKLHRLRDGSWVKLGVGNAQLLLHDVSGKV